MIQWQQQNCHKICKVLNSDDLKFVVNNSTICYDKNFIAKYNFFGYNCS